MHRLARTSALLLALVCLLDCRKAVEATPNGNVIGSWTIPDAQGKQTGEHTVPLDLPFGDKVEVHYTVGTIPHDGATLTAPLTASVKVVDAAGLQVQAGFNTTPMHFEGDPIDQRTLDVRVTSTRDTSGCASTGFESDTSILRLAPDGKIARVTPQPATAAPAKP